MIENENRQCERHHASLHIDVLAQDSKHVEQTRTIDISIEGMSFLSDQAIAVGKAVRARLYLPPKAHAINIVARVNYSVLQGTGGFRIGVKFTDMPAAESALLKATLAQFPAAH